MVRNVPPYRLRAIVGLWVVVSILCAPARGDAGANPRGGTDDVTAPRLVLTHESYALRSDPVLRCSGRIHAHLTFPTPLAGRHVLEAEWIPPSGEVAAHARVELDYTGQGRRTAYLWLDFDRDTGGLLSSLLGSTQAGGSSFEGQWFLEVRLDRQSILTTSVQMVCS